MVVFFGWAAMTFLPWLVLFTSSESIAGDVSSRAIRYSVLRTGRLSFAVGKALGQLVLVAGVTVLAALSFYLVGWTSIAGFEAADTAAGLLSYLPRILLYLLPFLAWAMCASMLTASANLARIVAAGRGGRARHPGRLGGAQRRDRPGPSPPPSGTSCSTSRPFPHKEGLTYPPGGALLSDMSVCLALTAVYFSVGFAVLRRRDL